MNLSEELAQAGYKKEKPESDRVSDCSTIDSVELHSFLDQYNNESLDDFHQRIFGGMDENGQPLPAEAAQPPPPPNPWEVVQGLTTALNTMQAESNNKFQAQEANISNLRGQITHLNQQNETLNTRLVRKGRNKIKIPNFNSDTTEWLLWKRNFISACINNDMDDGEKKRALQCAMSQNTQWQIYDYNIEESPWLEMSGDEFLELVDSRFNPLSREVQAIAGFEQIRQGANEVVEKFANKIRSLHKAAYPRATHIETNERVMIDKFIQGIYDSSLRIHILEKRPATLADALSVVTERMSFNSTAEYYSTGKVPVVAGTGARLMLGDGSPEDYSMGAVKAASPEESNVAAIRGQGTKRSSFKCHYCGLEGHYQRDCYKKKNQAAGRGGGRGQRRGQGRGRRGPLMKQGGNRPERPSGKGRGYKPARGIHAITPNEDEDADQDFEDEDSSNSGEE